MATYLAELLDSGYDVQLPPSKSKSVPIVFDQPIVKTILCQLPGEGRLAEKSATNGHPSQYLRDDLVGLLDRPRRDHVRRYAWNACWKFAAPKVNFPQPQHAADLSKKSDLPSGALDHNQA